MQTKMFQLRPQQLLKLQQLPRKLLNQKPKKLINSLKGQNNVLKLKPSPICAAMTQQPASTCSLSTSSSILVTRLTSRLFWDFTIENAKSKLTSIPLSIIWDLPISPGNKSLFARQLQKPQLRHLPNWPSSQWQTLSQPWRLRPSWSDQN